MSISEQRISTSLTRSHLGPPSFGRIATIESLREHLQWAIELEHFTLPPYLCALYSLDADRNPVATEVLASVLVEEMLHMTLVETAYTWAVFGDRSFEISLSRFGHEAIETFLKIEQPSPTGAPPEGDNYETIGQFYDAIKRGFRELSATLGEANIFCGDPARQVTTQHFHSGCGPIIAVDNLATALAALEEIVEQGEGFNLQVWDGISDVFHPEREQVAHYYRFQELKLGRFYRRGDTPRSGPTAEPISIDWDGVRPMVTNPRTSDHAAGSRIRTAQEKFNHSYCVLLQLLEQAFDGAPQMLGSAIGAMYTLMQTPTEDGLATAGPTFEYVSPDRRALRPQSAGERIH